MPTCLVVGCQSGSGNGIDKQYKYGSTPLPKSPEIRYVWLEKINRLDFLTYSSQGRFMLSWSIKKLTIFFMAI